MRTLKLVLLCLALQCILKFWDECIGCVLSGWHCLGIRSEYQVWEPQILHFSNATIKSLNAHSLEGIYLFTRAASYTIFIPVDQHDNIVLPLHAAAAGLSASQRRTCTKSTPFLLALARGAAAAAP